jgi:hypothetical protein
VDENCQQTVQKQTSFHYSLSVSKNPPVFQGKEENDFL